MADPFDIPVKILVQLGDDDPVVVATGTLPHPYDSAVLVDVITALGQEYRRVADALPG